MIITLYYITDNDSLSSMYLIDIPLTRKVNMITYYIIILKFRKYFANKDITLHNPIYVT